MQSKLLLTRLPADVQDQPADRCIRWRKPQQLRGTDRHHHQRPQSAAAMGAARVLGHCARKHSPRCQDSGELVVMTTWNWFYFKAMSN